MLTFTSQCAINPQKKQVVQIRKIQTDSDSDCDAKPHLLKTANILIALIRCMYIILSCSSEIYYLYLSFLSKGMKYLCKCNMVFCMNTSLLHGGSSTHKTSAGARTGIVRCPDGHRPICKEIFESSRRLSDIVRCPAGHRWNRTI